MEKIGSYEYNGESKTYKFKDSLTTTEKIGFVNSITDSLFVGDNFVYAAKDLFFDYFVIDFFTDIEDFIFATEDENGEPLNHSIDEIEGFIEETGIANIVIANAEQGVIAELVKAVELNIEYRSGIHSNPIAESLSSLLNTIERKFEAFDEKKAMKAMEVFGNINGEFTPEKMLEAYAKSDMYKKNWADEKSEKAQQGNFRLIDKSVE